jgi:16S rRNA (guanine527-N7)-methyltransferase
MFHVKHEGWEAAEALGVALDAPQLARVEDYERILLEQAVPMGMVGASDAGRLRERHILDSLRAAPLLPEAGVVCDLGSGAGLPGIVLAIARPDLPFVLVEVRKNRADLLERASADLPNVTVHPRRLETYREGASLCLARAFGPPARSWTVADGILERPGSLVYWAGQSFDPARDTPEGVELRLFRTPALARSGPLAIMTRQ